MAIDGISLRNVEIALLLSLVGSGFFLIVLACRWHPLWCVRGADFADYFAFVCDAAGYFLLFRRHPL